MTDRIKLEKQDWMFLLPLVLVAGTLLILHNYNDFLVTTRQGINFWNILFEGRLLYFYQDNVIASGNLIYDLPQGCAYSIVVYLVFAVWNIPLALLMNFTTIDVMNNTLCLAWAKLLMFGAVGLTAYLLNRLMIQLSIPARRRKLGLFLYGSSLLVCTSVYLTGGYDVLGLVFQLLGLSAFLKRDDKRFLLYFGIAVCFKYFALITFAPLLLLRWKRLDRILSRLVLVVLPYGLLSLPFRLAAMGLPKRSGATSAAALLEGLLAESATRELFYLGILLLLFYCFYTRQDTPENGVWSAMAANLLVFGLLSPYPYWTVLMAPFLILGIMLKPNLTEPLLLLEVAGCGAVLARGIAFYDWCFGKYNTLMAGLLGRLMICDPGEDYFFQIARACHFVWEKGLAPMLIVTCFGLITLLTMPALSEKFRWELRTHDLRLVCALRFAVNAAISLSPALCLLAELVVKGAL